MRILLVVSVDPWTRSVSTVHKYAAAAKAQGHEVVVFGPAHWELPTLSFTTDLSEIDLALFVMQVPSDLPDMPYLATLLDNLPRERRMLVDMWGRFNDTIRLEHDFNHLEKMDGHQGWEWEDAMSAVSDVIVQPTFSPLRPQVGSFLFHGFDPDSVLKPHATARQAAAAWKEREYGALYVGSNWQRWEQVRRFLESYQAVKARAGKACLVGWDWDERPQWAEKLGIKGVDTDKAFLEGVGVETRSGVRFSEVVELLGKARFAPIFHRPLFRHLRLVTNRTFETFYADAIPVLMLPRDFVASIYGEAGLALVPGDDVAAFLDDALTRPEFYWDAVLQVRGHLARHHSYAQRLGELAALPRTAPRLGAAA
jgi:hypothetical protein